MALDLGVNGNPNYDSANIVHSNDHPNVPISQGPERPSYRQILSPTSREPDIVGATDMAAQRKGEFL